jgi:hypothetical protein
MRAHVLTMLVPPRSSIADSCTPRIAEPLVASGGSRTATLGLPLERSHPAWPASLARRSRVLVAGFVAHYNTFRLHSVLGYINARGLPRCPRSRAIWADRDRRSELPASCAVGARA